MKNWGYDNHHITVLDGKYAISCLDHQSTAENTYLCVISEALTDSLYSNKDKSSVKINSRYRQ